MTEEILARDDRAYTVFQEALPLVHTVLVSYYRFMEEEAEAFEDTLCVWFHRLWRRSRGQQPNPQEFRSQLVFVACKYARAFQIAKYRGIEPEREQFTLMLARAPEEVALELLTKGGPR